MGYYCSMIPEELLSAAGFLPYRLRGSGATDTSKADAVLSRFNCSFVRCAFNLCIEGKYDFLDGILIANTCDHVRRMYDLLPKKAPHFKELPLFFLSIPHLITEAGEKWFIEEIIRVAGEIERTYDLSITSEDLTKSIDLHNRIKSLEKDLFILRESDSPPLTASEFLKISVIGHSIQKEEYETLLSSFLADVKSRSRTSDNRTRLLLAGSLVDNPAFLEIFENAGADIVSDALCSSWNLWAPIVVDQGTDRDAILASIGKHYYRNIHCPRMMDSHKQREEQLMERIKTAKVDGVILQRMEFCDLHGCNNMMFKDTLEKMDIPVLILDREYLMGDTARFATRAEAFIERIARR